MEGVIVILVLAGAGTWLGVRLYRRRPGRGQSMAEAIEANIPTFRIVSLGLQGSGKTLLLASMFHQLQAPAGQSYYLSASDADVARLNSWFTTMADASQPREWPEGTTRNETRRFVFGVKTRTATAVHEMLRLDYLEYAGELLTDVQEAGSVHQSELFAHLQEAHALIGILDGQRIRRYFDGHPGGWAGLQETLNILIPKMISATCPISFVITKWDLLAHLSPDENERLAIVRNMLMSNAQFRALIEVHGRDRVVRLIPVSAVGPGFVRFDERGYPVKVPTARAQPAYVDVPLSTVVPDVFDQAEMRLNRDLRAAVDAESRRLARQHPLDGVAAAASFAGQAAGRALIMAIGSPAVAVMGDALVGMFLETRRGLEERRTRSDRELSESEERADAFLAARRRAMLDMRGKADRLEGRLPNSRLSQGWYS